jgi:glycosyltransferase involved in cell wall biosynthesis
MICTCIVKTTIATEAAVTFWILSMPDELKNSMLPKNGRLILLFYHTMNSYGGVQTVIMRIAKEELLKGNRVTIICDEEDVISEAVTIGTQDIKSVPILVQYYSNEAAIDIIAFAPGSAAVAFKFCYASTKVGIKIRFATGVYHPRDFFRENEKPHLHFANFLLARALGAEAVFFMNEECRISHEHFLKTSLDTSKIIPVPMKAKERIWKIPIEKKLKIVCIGRIVPFKAYNFSIPEIIHSLVEEGIDVSCDIYGYGTHEAWLLEEIRSKSVSDRVKFKGRLPFKDFDQVVSKYSLFIGMGTSAVQAAQLGLPTLLAIDNRPYDCYGYFHLVPFGNVGEESHLIRKVNIHQMIHNHFIKSEEEIYEISDLCAKAGSAFVVDAYADQALDGREFKIGKGTFLGNAIVTFYRLVCERNKFTRVIGSVLRQLKVGISKAT